MGLAALSPVNILVVNAGSSTLKLSVIDAGDNQLAATELDAPRSEIDESALAHALAGFPSVDAVGHRIVHGGRDFHEPALITDGVVARLRALGELAPLHQAKSLDALAAVRQALGAVPAIACFDTAFHYDLPDAAATYALPREWRERFAIRRYGFHGLSHAYASRRAADLLGKPVAELRLVSCHLGAGASLAAVMGGRSVDTTMGFTPLEGLVMATRSGTVDPGLLLWLLEHAGIGEAELASRLEHESGLQALAGTGDMSAVAARAHAGEEEASRALDVYVHRLAGSIAAMAAAMGGMDSLLFTGGVGENAPEIRALTVERLGFLGLAIDPSRNEAAARDTDISVPAADVRTLVVKAREDLEIARQVRRVM